MHCMNLHAIVIVVVVFYDLMTFTYAELKHALTLVISLGDQSKYTIYSAHDPNVELRSEDSLLFNHLRHLDSNGCLLRCL